MASQYKIQSIEIQEIFEFKYFKYLLLIHLFIKGTCKSQNPVTKFQVRAIQSRTERNYMLLHP